MPSVQRGGRQAGAELTVHRPRVRGCGCAVTDVRPHAAAGPASPVWPSLHHRTRTAALLDRSARSRGLTVHSSIDGLITAVAVRTCTAVLARDRSFENLAPVRTLVMEHPPSW